ncbi:MAG: hypothetical protein H0V01_03680 [Bacteroidetes bacterium]|nr:hypothetical protein [Bacteroidota bacterium]HET6245511.1 DUF6089 family protein [Bacteroidia bacterium]
MKRLSFLLFFIFATVLTGFSQGSELGVFGGGSFYMGDLNPNKLFYRTKPAFGLIYRKLLNPRYALKSNLVYGNLEAYDSDSNNPVQRARNLNFRTKIIELSGQIEFNFLPYDLGDPNYPFSPYIFAGISVFRFNPQAYINNTLVDLRPMSTEGQGASPGKSAYALTQLAFPFGIGLKISLANRVGLGIEWGFRKTSTDYLDDVSTTYPNSGLQRGNSKTKDWYSLAGIMLTYKIGPKIAKCPAYK